MQLKNGLIDWKFKNVYCTTLCDEFSMNALCVDIICFMMVGFATVLIIIITLFNRRCSLAQIHELLLFE